ncbi:hypothetical protein Cylst_4369 [Cylindrospermum stagnale PCC 7417]|uniref:Uncharacterized protein n=2 Tax=Cylindrospermum stagnale TaxID=142864 RepID=K9X1G1_9NOST|nr:hypothetical protein Cylst_4369 [Cylindrospermum stagnale PCC 7417]
MANQNIVELSIRSFGEYKHQLRIICYEIDLINMVDQLKQILEDCQNFNNGIVNWRDRLISPVQNIDNHCSEEILTWRNKLFADEDE